MKVTIKSDRPNGLKLHPEVRDQIEYQADLCIRLLNLQTAPALTFDVSFYVEPSPFATYLLEEQTVLLNVGGHNRGKELDNTIRHEIYHHWEFRRGFVVRESQAEMFAQFPCHEDLALARRRNPDLL